MRNTSRVAGKRCVKQMGLIPMPSPSFIDKEFIVIIEETVKDWKFMLLATWFAATFAWGLISEIGAIMELLT